MMERPDLWYVIAALAAGSFMLRFTFLGLVGDRPLPEWLLRHLRYTAVAVLPALRAPMIIRPAATGRSFDLPRGLAAFATPSAALWFRSVMASCPGGAAQPHLAH